VVEKGTPGIRQGKKESKLGIRASHTAEVVLEDCRIPVENLLGGTEKLERRLHRARSGESSGRASNALATFELTRPIVGASALGIAQAAYEWTLAHLGGGAIAADPLELALDQSSTAGRPPLQRQGNQQILAQVATEIEAARLLVQRAAWMGRNGIPMTGGQGSMSKLKAGQVTVWVTRTLIDLVGPYAYTSECPLEKWFRDAKIYELFEGTAEIQRLVISRMQVAEYEQRLLEAAAIAAQGAEPAASQAPSPV
jgi:alkylation response protein AidB-like acyl-CoA dehydrogenase